MKQKQDSADTENTLVVAKGAGVGEGWIESLGWTCTHCYIKMENKQGPTV